MVTRAPAKKTATRKSAPANAVIKETAAKKTVAKKTVAKKTVAKKTVASAAASLAKYRSMRDFDKTKEPSGSPTGGTSGNSFVIQKHAASHLHYDFRLEHDGVLLSWSVPKGPSLRAGERRLAVRTEDHPLEYASFEGIIPKGEYGGGTVIVWDRGTWKPENDIRKMLEKGHLAFDLTGEKLQGRFHLVRTAKPGDKRENWLLFKGKDAAANGSDILSERPESVISGRSIEQVAEAPDDVWHSNRTPKENAARTTTSKKVASEPVEGGPARSAKPKNAKSQDEQTESGRADVIGLVKRLPLPFALTNLDKVLYPENNLRKADLLAYYAAVASHALPHLAGRPLTLVRCPGGRTQKCFFQKHATANVPAAVKRIEVRESSADESELYMAVTDMPGLLAVAQMGALELHTWTCHADKLEQPDQWVFDLDPDVGLAWDLVVEAAFLMRERLSDLGLISFVKTTGGKGLHVVVPVANKLDWTAHHAFAKAVADSVAREQPERYLTNMRKDLRKGKLFIDYMRNGRGATAIAPYSTRSREGAPVATPISWQELEDGVDPASFDVYGVIRRLEKLAVDPWRDYASTKQTVSASALKSLKLRV